MATSIAQAVIVALGADSTLATLAPGGVWLDVAPARSADDVHIIVTLQSDRDEPTLPLDRAYEDAFLMVKAVGLGTGAASAMAAADRIDTLLQGGSLTLDDGTLMAMFRTERLRYVEVEGDLRYQHVGGVYEAVVSR